MNVFSFRPRLLGSSVIVAAAIAFGATVPAFADSVTETVTGGSFTATLSTTNTMAGAATTAAAAPSAGSMTVTASDLRGVGTGWNVSVIATDFTYTSGGNGTAFNHVIPAAGLTLTTPGAAVPAANSQAIGALSNGPKDLAVDGTPIDATTQILQAATTYGDGTYDQALPMSLNVPAYTAAGLYTSTITVTNIQT